MGPVADARSRHRAAVCSSGGASDPSPAIRVRFRANAPGVCQLAAGSHQFVVVASIHAQTREGAIRQRKLKTLSGAAWRILPQPMPVAARLRSCSSGRPILPAFREEWVFASVRCFCLRSSPALDFAIVFRNTASLRAVHKGCVAPTFPQGPMSPRHAASNGSVGRSLLRPNLPRCQPRSPRVAAQLTFGESGPPAVHAVPTALVGKVVREMSHDCLRRCDNSVATQV